MARPKFICLYVSYLDSIAIHSYETRGKLLTAMLEYASTGQEVKVPKSVESFWISMRQQIDRDLEKYEQICEANRIKGAKGRRWRRLARPRHLGEGQPQPRYHRVDAIHRR